MTTFTTRRTGGVSLAAAFAVALPAAALAATDAVTTDALNLRAGPGTDYELITTMPANSGVSIVGCVEDTQWCRITYGGREGWASARYMQVTLDGSDTFVAEVLDAIPTISLDDTDTVAATAGGAATGAVVAGPVGAVSGGAAGAAIAEVTDTPAEVDNYIVENPADPVNLRGEVAVGSDVPREVALYDIPGYEYDYASLNGRTVLVDPDTRQIVRVYR